MSFQFRRLLLTSVLCGVAAGGCVGILGFARSSLLRQGMAPYVGPSKFGLVVFLVTAAVSFVLALTVRKQWTLENFLAAVLAFVLIILNGLALTQL